MIGIIVSVLVLFVKDTEGFHIDVLGNEGEVDLCRIGRGIAPVLEGISLFGHLGFLLTILQDRSRDFVAGVAAFGIEVTTDQGRIGILSHALENESQPFVPGLFDLMIQMNVKDIDVASFGTSQQGIDADTVVFRAPSQGHLVWCFAQPEEIVVDQFERLFVEYGKAFGIILVIADEIENVVSLMQALVQVYILIFLDFL